MDPLLVGTGIGLGLIVGSFLNVIILRFGTARSALAGRSHCPHCQTTLTVWELVPVFSFLAQRGRCRSCQVRLSWQYPVVEGLTAVGTSLILAMMGVTATAILSLFFFWTVLVIGVIDVRHYLIPDRAVGFLIVLSLLSLVTVPPLREFHLGNAGLGALVGGGLLLLIVLFTRGQGMGLGDAKLGFALGLGLGWPLIGLGLLLAFVFGAVIGLGLITTGVKDWKDPVPFGPFLLLGSAVAMIEGDRLLAWFFLNSLQ